MAGEIRLQWWREVLDGQRAEEAAANPVAAALLDAIQRYHLPPQRLIVLIDERSSDLYHEPPRNLETYGTATDGTIIALAAYILGGEGIEVEHIARRAGLARIYAAARRPEDARRHLNAARGLLPLVPPEILPALLPVAVIGASLSRKLALPLWRRQWLIWRAARNPQRIFR
jgi:phytoene synthase